MNKDAIIDMARAAGIAVGRNSALLPKLERFFFAAVANTREDADYRFNMLLKEKEMNHIEAIKYMKARIEALKRLSDNGRHRHIPGLSTGACWELAIELEQFIAAIEQQPADKPVAWKNTDVVECPVCRDKGFPWPKCGHITYLDHTTPPAAQRPLVSLTEQDKDTAELAYSGVSSDYIRGYEAGLEAADDKLREKNGGAA